MCYYDCIGFSCGVRVWGQLRRRCRFYDSDDSDQQCQRRWIERYTGEPSVCPYYQGRCRYFFPILHSRQIKTLCSVSDCVLLEGHRSDHKFWSSLDISSRHSYRSYLLLWTSCSVQDCFLAKGHQSPHEIWTQCSTVGCTLVSKHQEPHVIFHEDMRTAASRLELLAKAQEKEVRSLSLKVLSAMGASHFLLGTEDKESNDTSEDVRPSVSRLESLLRPARREQIYYLGDGRFVSIPETQRKSFGPEGREESSDVSRRKSLTRTPLILKSEPLLSNRPDNQDPKQRLPTQADIQEPGEKLLIRSARNTRTSPSVPTASDISSYSFPYSRLNLSNRQVRLFELFPKEGISSVVHGAFQCVELPASPEYTALSYTWGIQATTQKIKVGNDSTMCIGENLWWFLHLQSSIISRPALYWIDAICINQSDVHERNHQIGLMKQIYTSAKQVFVWLGREADNSNIAMDFIQQQSRNSLRSKGPGYYHIWSRKIGRAVHALCERRYWRRMWIIQEILHAQNITVWCGQKSFAWADFEALYLKLKELEATHWISHHEFGTMVMQSPAAVMVWQRAHWRHPDTPTPNLQTLVEVFRTWQCTDLRDRVFALVGMATEQSAMIPDYDLSTRDIYFAVLDKTTGNKAHFGRLLSQLLGLSARDIELSERDMVEYKTHASEVLVLRARTKGIWESHDGCQA